MALKTAARWTVLGVLFLIPFIPLFVANTLFFPFITGKGFLFRILMEVGAGAYVLLALADPKYRPKFSWTLLLYAAFVVWMAVADFLAINPHKAFWSNYERMDGWITMIHVFLFFVVAGTVLSADRLWKRWWQVVLGASLLVTLYGLWQMLGLTAIHQGGVRADASLGNAIYLAVYLMFTIGIAVSQAVETKGFWRYALLALAALQLVVVFATATRGVILGIFAAAGLVAVLMAFSSGGKTRNVAVSVIVALVALAGAFFLVRDTAFVRNDPTLTRIATVFESGELKVRFTLWRMAFEGFLARPVTGWGQEGYNYVFNTFYDPSLYGQEPWFDRAHNTYLDWLIAGGLPALLLFLALIGAAGAAVFRSDATRHERFILLGILAAYLIQAVSAFDNLFSYLFLAAVLAMAHERSMRDVPALARLPAAGGMALGAIALPATVVVTIAAVWVVNVPGIEAAGDLIDAANLEQSDPAAGVAMLKQASARGSFATQEIAEQAVGFAANLAPVASVPVDTRQAAANLGSSLMNAEIARAPKDARLYVMYAGLLRSAGDGADAIRAMNAAIALSPQKQQLYFERGIEEWQAGDKASAAKDFETAYALDTTYQAAASYAAAGKVLEGDVAGSDAILADAYGTTTVDADILRFAYYDAKLYDRLLASVMANVAVSPDDPSRHLLLAQTYLFAGRTADARAELVATLAAHPEAASAAASLMAQLGVK